MTPASAPRRYLLPVLRYVGRYCRELVYLAWTFDPRLLAADMEARAAAGDPPLHRARAVGDPGAGHPERAAGHLPPSLVEQLLWADLTSGRRGRAPSASRPGLLD
jgi:hypothetical protein